MSAFGELSPARKSRLPTRDTKCFVWSGAQPTSLESETQITGYAGIRTFAMRYAEGVRLFVQNVTRATCEHRQKSEAVTINHDYTG